MQVPKESSEGIGVSTEQMDFVSSLNRNVSILPTHPASTQVQPRPPYLHRLPPLHLNIKQAPSHPISTPNQPHLTPSQYQTTNVTPYEHKPALPHPISTPNQPHLTPSQHQTNPTSPHFNIKPAPTHPISTPNQPNVTP
jgi:hypothetical protein